MAAVPPAPAADSWVDNTNVGNFNPGTKSGQAIFENKTKGLKEDNRLTATKKDAQAISLFLENRAPALGKFVSWIPITYDAVGDPTEWENLIWKYGSIYLNILQREAHKCFRKPVDIVGHLYGSPFTVTTLDSSNVNNYKKLFYSRVDSQVAAELIKNILTDDEYSNMMLKNNICLLLRMIPPVTKELMACAYSSSFSIASIQMLL